MGLKAGGLRKRLEVWGLGLGGSGLGILGSIRNSSVSVALFLGRVKGFGVKTWDSGMIGPRNQGLQACTPMVAPLGFGILLRDPRGLHWLIEVLY